MDRVLPRWR